jgi:hypothetical protein
LKKSVIPHDQLMPFLFAVCLYLLVMDLDKHAVLEIDEEYTGKDKIIGNALVKLLGGKWRGEVRFKRIGKGSSAHKLAWDTHRSSLKKRSVRKLKLDEILKFFAGK